MSARLYRRQLTDGTTVEVHSAEADGALRLTAVVRAGGEILQRLTVPAQLSRAAEQISEQARDLAIDALRAAGR